MDSPKLPPNNLNPIRMDEIYVVHERETELLEQILFRGKEKKLIEITGAAGIGKTTFVRMTAQRALESGRFPGGVYWLDFRNASNLSKMLTDIIYVLNIPIKISNDIRSEVINYVENNATLFIFDSLEALEGNDDEIMTFIRNLARHSKGTKIIFIGRNTNRVIRSDSQLHIEGLTLRDSINFIEKSLLKTNIKLTDNQYKKIYEISDGSPLFLSLIKSQLEEGLSIEDVLTFRNRENVLGITTERLLYSLPSNIRELVYILCIFEAPASAEILNQVAGSQNIIPNLKELSNLSFVISRNGRYSLHPTARNLLREQIHNRDFMEYEENFVAAYIPIARSKKKELIRDELLNIIKAFNLALTRNQNLAEEYINAISDYLFSINQPIEVIQLINTALTDAGVNTTQNIYVSLVNIRAAAYMHTKRFDEAISEFQNLLMLDVVKRSPRLSGLILSNLGGAYIQIEDGEKALKVLKRSLDIAQDIGDYKNAISVLGTIASIHENNYDPKIFKIYDQMRGIAIQTGDKALEANILELKAKQYARDDDPKAFDVYDQILGIAIQTGDKVLEANTFGRKANLYLIDNLSSMALSLYQQQLLLFREMEDQVGEFTALINIGKLYIENGQNDLSEQSYLNALELSSRLGYQEFRAQILNQLAEIRKRFGDLDAAMVYANEGILLAEQLENKMEIARGSIVIGDCRKELRSYDDAIYSYQRATQIYHEENRMWEMAPLYLKLAEVYEAIYQEQNQPDALDTAIENYLLAQSKAEAIKQENTSWIAQAQLGGLYVIAYRKSGEQKYYQDALKILSGIKTDNESIQSLCREYYGRAHYARYQFKGEKEELETAKENLQKALDFAVSKNNLSKWIVIAPVLSKVYFELKEKVDWNKIWGFGLQSIKGISRSDDSYYIDRVISVITDNAQAASQKGEKNFALQQLIEISEYFQNSELKIPDAVQIALNNLRSELGEEKFALMYADAKGKLTSGIASLLEESRTLMGNNQFESAALKLSEALTLLVDDNKEDFKRQKATILFLRGICQREQQLWEIALKDQELAFELYASLKDLAGQAHALLEIGFLYEFMNSYEDARLHYTDAYRLYKKINEKSGMASAVEHLGMLEFRVRMYPQAVENLEEARSLYTELGERDKVSRLEIDLVDARTGLQQQGSNTEENHD